MLRAVIVDDEPLAREGLIADLRAIGEPHLDIAGVAANAFGALDVIRRERPDVLFLDIEMPEMNGFELLAQLEPEEMPAAVIVVTAYNEHALRGHDANALDFLLKPYSRVRLQSAVDRAATRVREVAVLRAAHEAQAGEASIKANAESTRAAETTGLRGSQFLERIVVTERDRTVVIPVGHIEWVEAQSYYARLHAPPKSFLLRERMAVLEESLDPACFFRSHRSAIVRIAAVRSIDAMSRYEHEITLASGARAPLSGSRRTALERVLAARK